VLVVAWRRVERAICGMLSAALLFAASARADPESDAKDLFERGRELRARGDCAGAVDLFKRAITVFPIGLGSQRNLAECEETLEHYAASKRAWLDLGRALNLAHDPKYDGWGDDARKAVERLAPKTARLRVDIVLGTSHGEVPLAKGDAVEVVLDGEVLDRVLLGTEVERDPGPHELRVQGASATAAVSRHVVLLAGESTTVKLAVPLRVDALVSVAPLRSAPARVIGWTLVGIGGAAFIAAGVSLAVRQTALGDLERACPDYQTSACNPSVESTVSRGRLASTMTTAFGVAGLVGLAGGVTLVLVSSRGKDVTVRAGLFASSIEHAF
jgi:hypothetical protein